MKVLLSMLYRNFNVERAGGAEGVRENFAFGMLPVGLKVRLRRRSRALADTGTAESPAAPGRFLLGGQVGKDK